MPVVGIYYCQEMLPKMPVLGIFCYCKIIRHLDITRKFQDLTTVVDLHVQSHKVYKPKTSIYTFLY